uniref:EF-hand domain-containing protein n=1 Tax=Plectus sambesii TaxID=2011161 RepID=A0A914X8M3_9BILA
MSFILESEYSGSSSSYFYLREANDDGTVVTDQSGEPITLGIKGNRVIADGDGDLKSDDSNLLRVEYTGGTETCLVNFGYSSGMLAAQLYDYDESGPVAKLIQDYGSSMAQQWSFELTTDIDAQFNRLDQNNDGELTLDEYVNVTDPLALQNGYYFSILLKAFINYDTNSDGFVTKDEKKAYMKRYNDARKDALVNQTLGFIKDFDENDDIMLQSDEMKLFLASAGELLTKDSFATTFMKYDKNGDKGLNVDEMGEFLINTQYEIHDFIPLVVKKSFDKASTIHY